MCYHNNSMMLFRDNNILKGQDFYGIKEGDNMYLAPEDRVNIW